MTLTEKVAYLKGLAEGLELDEKSKETKVFKTIFDILEDLALTVTDIDEVLELVEEHLDAVDEDLDELESYVYEDYDDYDDDEEYEDGLYELECPACSESFCIDDEMLDEEFIECPACGEKLELDLDIDYDCGCGCDCESDDE